MSKAEFKPGEWVELSPGVKPTDFAPLQDNPSGITPIEYNVVVKPDELEEKTKGGVLLPDEVKERDQYGHHKGRLVAVSPMAFDFEEWPEGVDKPRVGQTVVFVKYAGTLVPGRDGEEYRVCKDKDILAIWED